MCGHACPSLRLFGRGHNEIKVARFLVLRGDGLLTCHCRSVGAFWSPFHLFPLFLSARPACRRLVHPCPALPLSRRARDRLAPCPLRLPSALPSPVTRAPSAAPPPLPPYTALVPPHPTRQMRAATTPETPAPRRVCLQTLPPQSPSSKRKLLRAQHSPPSPPLRKCPRPRRRRCSPDRHRPHVPPPPAHTLANKVPTRAPNPAPSRRSSRIPPRRHPAALCALPAQGWLSPRNRRYFP